MAVREELKISGHYMINKLLFGDGVAVSVGRQTVVKESIPAFFGRYLGVCDALGANGTLRRIAQALLLETEQRERDIRLNPVTFNPFSLLCELPITINGLEWAGIAVMAGELSECHLVNALADDSEDIVIAQLSVWTDVSSVSPSRILSGFSATVKVIDFPVQEYAQHDYSELLAMLKVQDAKLDALIKANRGEWTADDRQDYILKG